MLHHPTLDRLHELGLEGMAKGFRDLATNPESNALDHAEWLGLLVEHEATLRQQKRFEARARTAKLRHAATVEDVNYRAARGLDRAVFLRLTSCDWIREHRHCLITGPCGVGKSWLACALGDKPSVPMTMRHRPIGSSPLRAEVTASDGYARIER